MNKAIFAYIFGLASGFAAAYFTIKKAYDERLEDEIQSIREEAKEKRNLSTEDKDDTENHKSSKIVIDSVKTSFDKNPERAENLVKEFGYIPDEVDESVEERAHAKSVIIDQEQMSDDYQCITFVYYNDGVYLDENQERVTKEEVDAIIPKEAQDLISKPRDESVFLWNKRLKCFYELTRAEDTYKNLLEKYPYLREDE